MQFLALLMLVSLITGCSTAPTPKVCSAKWDLLDSGAVSKRQASEVRDVIHPDETVYFDRDCSNLSAEKGIAIFNMVNLIKELGSDLDSWTSNARETKSNLDDEDKEWVEDFKRNQKNLDSLPIPYTDAETKERIDDLLTKLEVFKKLKSYLKKAGREAQYLIPKHFKKSKDWIGFETTSRDEQEVKKLVKHLENKEKARVAKNSNQKAYNEEQDRFLHNGFHSYNITKVECDLSVVQSDGIDNFGLSLGQTIFRLSKSKVFEIEKAEKNGNLFVLNLINKSNNEKVVFNFNLKKYAILDSARLVNTSLTEKNAMYALTMALN